MKRYLFSGLLFFSSISLVLSILFFYKINEKIPIEKPVLIKIKKGETVKKIAYKLEKKGVISNKFIFVLYTLIKRKSLKHGYYEFKGSKSIKDIWKILSTGKEKLILFTIIPGEDLIDIGKKLEKAGLVEKAKFYRYVFNQEKVREKGLQGSSFEGYFPPETYFLRKDSSIDEIVDAFLHVFHERYTPILKTAKNLTPYQAMIIASIVEKETSISEEKPIIAGIIINRLKKKMKLQIDPTIIYALKRKEMWDGNLNKKNMKIKSPYNTYLNYGLPPTPICSFSIESLKAVLNYKKTEYLYYFSADKKTHYFSKTYREHLKKIKETY